MFEAAGRDERQSASRRSPLRPRSQPLQPHPQQIAYPILQVGKLFSCKSIVYELIVALGIDLAVPW